MIPHPARILRLALSSLLAFVGTVMTATAQEKVGAAGIVPVDVASLAEEIKARRPAPQEMPAAVRDARVEAQIIVPAAAGRAPLTITRIVPPALPAKPEIHALSDGTHSSAPPLDSSLRGRPLLGHIRTLRTGE